MKASSLVSRPRRTRGHTYIVGVISAVGLGALAAAVACSNSTPTRGTEATLDIDSDTIFELDGNALDGAPTGDDWNTLSAGGGAAIAYTGVLADPAPNSIFTGGRKDIQAISDWSHKAGAVPDKDNITNAYAAAYNVGGDLEVFFGADRYANEGDAQLGFWFFQSEVKAQSNGSFSGGHQVGDLLVLANFVNGGEVPQIQVLKWVGSGGNQQGGTLQLLLDSTAECGTGGLNDEICAITNLAATDSPWPYTPKGGAPGDDFPIVTFFEGGVNISQLFPASVPCFASFMAETRSSTSVTASLKDFVLGSFPVCGLTITKVCDTSSVNADETAFVYGFHGTVTNTGFGPLYDVTVTDKGVNYQLGTLAGGASANFSDTFESLLNPATNTASVAAAATSGGAKTITASMDEPATCPPVDIDPSLSVTKTCDIRLEAISGVVAVVVDFSGQICNDSSGPDAIGLTGAKVVDDGGTPSDPTDDQTFDIGDLAVGACAPYSGQYVPGDTTSGDPLEALFSDTVTASGTSNLGFGDVTETASASCLVCPATN